MVPKLQRWIDLLAALLRRRYPVSFEQLIEDVPGYQARGKADESRRRVFERDKDELRRFGVPIITQPQTRYLVFRHLCHARRCKPLWGLRLGQSGVGRFVDSGGRTVMTGKVLEASASLRTSGQGHPARSQ